MSAQVEVGFFSFTEVTDPSQHVAYNLWHQLDHLPQQFEIPGIVHGQRWVSTPQCKRLRAFESQVLRPVQYVTLYLMTSPVDATLERFMELAGTLRAKGRFFEHRKARLSGPFGISTTAAADRALVSADVLPFRPNLGVYVVVEDLEGRGIHRDPAKGDSQGRAERLLRHEGVAGVWTFDSRLTPAHPRWGPGHTSVTVCYLDEPPLRVAPDLGDLVRELWSGVPAPQLAGPFETITPWEWDWGWGSL